MRTMFKETTIGLIPEEWKAVKITDYCDFIRGTEPGSDSYNRDGMGIPFIRVGNIAAQIQELVFTTSSNIELCASEDILISFDGSPGVVVEGFTGAYSSGIRKVITLKTDIDKDYLYFVLQTRLVQEVIEKYSDGVTIKHASKALPHIRIPLPPLFEQRKIAEIFSIVDETIEKTEAIIQETQQLKNSLIQKLFTEGIGHTRFKETKIGRIPEEWEIVNLGSMIAVLTDYHANGSYESLKANVTLLSAPDYAIMVRTVNFEQNDWENLKYVSEHAYNYLEKSKVYINDLVMNKIANPGRVFFVPDTNMPMSLGMNLFLIRMKEDLALNKFYYYYLRYREGYVKRFAAGSTTKTITKDAVRRLEVVAPPLPEQCQIAEILSEVDARIKAEQAFKSELQHLKKGLMQVMLTGKVRVKV